MSEAPRKQEHDHTADCDAVSLPLASPSPRHRHRSPALHSGSHRPSRRHRHSLTSAHTRQLSRLTLHEADVCPCLHVLVVVRPARCSRPWTSCSRSRSKLATSVSICMLECAAAHQPLLLLLPVGRPRLDLASHDRHLQDAVRTSRVGFAQFEHDAPLKEARPTQTGDPEDGRRGLLVPRQAAGRRQAQPHQHPQRRYRGKGQPALNRLYSAATLRD